MNWFRENRWLGTFLIVCGVSALLALFLLFKAKSNFEEAFGHFNDAAAERNRLQHLDPFPNEANYQQLKVHFENYNAALNKLKDELKTQVRPIDPLAPNEFQSRLRQAIIAVSEKARGNKVKLPDNFHVGFDEFTAALPSTASAPLLGQELAQAEVLMNILIDARVDAVTGFQRTSVPAETAATTPAARKPAGTAITNPKVIERNIVDLSFVAAPSAARKVLNEIGGSTQQFFIIRTLHVRNEQEKGPVREQSASSGAAPSGAAATATTATPTGAIKFIVGNEHIQIGARIEMVRFIF